jgi:hypothetical protein
MLDLILYQIRITRYVNSLTFEEKGIRIFYSKTALLISLLKNIGIIVIAIYFLNLYSFNIYVVIFFSIAFFIVLLDLLTDVIPRFLYKNPIFIFSENALLCTKNDTTYDLITSNFIKYKAHKQIIGYKIRIQRQDKTKKFDENLFWIKNFKYLSNHICKVKGIHRLPNDMDLPKEFYDFWDN